MAVLVDASADALAGGRAPASPLRELRSTAGYRICKKVPIGTGLSKRNTLRRSKIRWRSDSDLFSVHSRKYVPTSPCSVEARDSGAAQRRSLGPLTRRVIDEKIWFAVHCLAGLRRTRTRKRHFENPLKWHTGILLAFRCRPRRWGPGDRDAMACAAIRPLRVRILSAQPRSQRWRRVGRRQICTNTLLIDLRSPRRLKWTTRASSLQHREVMAQGHQLQQKDAALAKLRRHRRDPSIPP
jgi:hypothetical protein